MKQPPQILIADDSRSILDILKARLAGEGYQILTASDGAAALDLAKEKHPDLILLDVMMPELDGVEVCRRLKGDESIPFIPIVMVTAKSDRSDVIAGLEAGAEEYLTKPVDQMALLARVKSMLRIKELHDKGAEQTLRLKAQARELEDWKIKLEERVADQVEDLERLGELKQFLSPQVAEVMVSSAQQHLLESHRREITAVFCDLRGFTAFSETAEPEEVMNVLQEYHQAVGPLISNYEATIEHFAGDGFLAFFNDPLPCPDPADRAVRMSVGMQRSVGALIENWGKRGITLGFGVGIAMGYATLGRVGFEGRFHYGAIGNVLNLASRLCDEAKSGQILITQQVNAATEHIAETIRLEDFALKGFLKPVPTFNVQGLKISDF